ncbi:hypothetical protein F7725_014946 [Dissostichus mawsoni]|uniref:Uncharacterized protein n=1 Tax=Dissostichus mawsoni TaxID=36200 RepID=A0A7J5YI59_DISMA|nr:hypothetical protein F7725_014946 [Dissostichus mawsoni]
MDYKSVGRKLPGTRFIAFKVPLKQALNRQLQSSEVFGLWELLESVQKQRLDLGHEVPGDDTILSFKRAVRTFLRENANNGETLAMNEAADRSALHTRAEPHRVPHLQCSTRLEVTRWRDRTTCTTCREDPRGVVDLCFVLHSNDGMDESEQEPIRGLASHRPNLFLPEQRAIAHIHKTAFFLTLNPTENISTSIDGPPPRLKTSGRPRFSPPPPERRPRFSPPRQDRRSVFSPPRRQEVQMSSTTPPPAGGQTQSSPPPPDGETQSSPPPPGGQTQSSPPLQVDRRRAPPPVQVDRRRAPPPVQEDRRRAPPPLQEDRRRAPPPLPRYSANWTNESKESSGPEGDWFAPKTSRRKVHVFLTSSRRKVHVFLTSSRKEGRKVHVFLTSSRRKVHVFLTSSRKEGRKVHVFSTSSRKEGPCFLTSSRKEQTVSMTLG